jgi:hypothetical protein
MGRRADRARIEIDRLQVRPQTEGRGPISTVTEAPRARPAATEVGDLPEEIVTIARRVRR